MDKPTIEQTPYFLWQGGEMGAVIRNFNWENTPLGNWKSWPISLRVTLDSLLNSGFPMLLMWGDDYTCFYNDAFDLLLKRRTAASAIGENGEKVWTYNWEVIQPLVENVKKTGKPVFYEDHLVKPKNRPNTSDAYWTFSCSLVRNDAGEPAGVLFTCVETTASVLAIQQAKESENRFRSLADQLPQFIWLTGTTGINITYTNQPFIDFLGLKNYTEFLDSTWEQMTHPDDLARVQAAYLEAFDKKEPYNLEIRFKNAATRQYNWFLVRGRPYYEGDQFEGYVGTLTDISERKDYESALLQSEANFRSIIEQAPIPTAVFVGRELRIDVANKPMLKVWGKDEAVFGKSLAEAIPELQGQPYLELLDRVFTSGLAHEENAAPAYLEVEGQLQLFYFNFTYKPLRNLKGEVYAIIDMAIDVTEEVQAKNALEASEKNLLNLFNDAPVGIATVSAGRKFIVHSANRYIANIGGRVPEDLLGRPMLDIVPELAGQGFDELLEEVIKTGMPYSANAVPANILKDGSLQLVYISFTFQPRKSEDGLINDVLVVVTDVTQEMLNRNKIVESERNLRNIVMKSPFGIAMLSGNPVRADMFNDSFLTITGKSREAFERLPFWEVLKEAAPFYEDTLDAVFKTGIPFQVTDEQINLIRKGREETGYFNFVYEPVLNTNGKVAKVMLFVVEVTEQKLSNDRVAESEERFRTMAEGASILIAVGDESSNAVYFNKAWSDLTGRSLQELLNVGWADLIHPEDRERYVDIYLAAFKEKKPFTGEFRILNKEGQYRWLLSQGPPRFRSDGSFAGYISSSVDITLQREFQIGLENEVLVRTSELEQSNLILQQTNVELQRSNANLEEFAHAASHDLKEPIRKIQIFTQQLKVKLEEQLEQEEKQLFHRIENSTARMGQLVDDLLLYSHASHRPLVAEQIDLNEKIHRVLEDLDLDIAEKKAVIDVGPLPIVLGFGRQLQQLFQNLLSNALKYSKANESPKIEIWAERVQENKNWYDKISVRDNGIGFDIVYSEKIFQMFARLHGRDEYGGTGVGLSIVKKVVENHYGVIRVQSEIGTGTTFELLLPAE